MIERLEVPQHEGQKPRRCVAEVRRSREDYGQEVTVVLAAGGASYLRP